MRVWPYYNSVFQGNAVEFLFYVYMETYLFPVLVCVSLTSKKSSLVTMVTISELKKLNISLLLHATTVTN